MIPSLSVGGERKRVTLLIGLGIDLSEKLGTCIAFTLFRIFYFKQVSEIIWDKCGNSI